MKLSVLFLAAVCLYNAAVIIAAPINDNVVNEHVQGIHMPKDTPYVDFSGMDFLQKRKNKHTTTMVKYMTKSKKFKTTLTLTVKGKPRERVLTTTLKHKNNKHHKTASTLKPKESKLKHFKSRSKKHSKKSRHRAKNTKDYSNKHSQESNDSNDFFTNAGKGTFFSPNRGSCGWKNTKNDLIVAVNAPDMANKKHKSDENPNCGRMVEIANESGDKVMAQVADTCPECSKGDLDLSPAAFIKLAPFKQGIVKIRWRYL
ncbi:riboflavin aldehydeforming enzyme [Mucor ambiguus]|uniref:Riboflavin aldehydeforming enzyme n=1 Tax=Mucor ambiguus TaxID=91626 RepID=A0A0C9MP75_9FUNG|nr:riboflavin aldehydeforming enzyme [Mucor ambiguus]